MSNVIRYPTFVCEECDDHAIEIPEWTDDQVVLSCKACGKPIGTIQYILEVLHKALMDNENRQPDSDQDSQTR